MSRDINIRHVTVLLSQLVVMHQVQVFPAGKSKGGVVVVCMFCHSLDLASCQHFLSEQSVAANFRLANFQTEVLSQGKQFGTSYGDGKL